MRGSFRVVRRKSGRRRGLKRERETGRETRSYLDGANGATGESPQEGRVDRSVAN